MQPYFGYLVDSFSEPSQKTIYTSTFPNTYTPKMAENPEISVYFSTNAILALCHARRELRNSKCAGFQTKDATELESCKQV